MSFAQVPRKNTNFTTNTLVNNTVFVTSFTSPTQVTIVNTTYNNITNNYNLVQCDGCQGCSQCGSKHGSVVEHHEDDASSLVSKKFTFDVWDTFTDVIHAIYHLLLEFSLGEFEHVASKLSMDYYNSISEMLLEIKMDPIKYPEYELVRATLSKTFIGLFQARSLYLSYLEEKKIAEALQAKAAILDNLDSLKEYIQNMNQNTMADIFPPANITTLPVIIKPEYLEYIKLYGFPENALFDTDKLAEILMRLGIPDHYSQYSMDSSGSVPDPDDRYQLEKELVESIEFDFSGVPLALGKAALTVNSTGQDVLDYYGLRGHADASAGVYDASGGWHRNRRFHDGSDNGVDDDVGPFYTW